MSKKEKVVIFLKSKIEDLNYRIDKKDIHGDLSWCPASRCAFKNQLGYYEYLLKMIESSSLKDEEKDEDRYSGNVF